MKRTLTILTLAHFLLVLLVYVALSGRNLLDRVGFALLVSTIPLIPVIAVWLVYRQLPRWMPIAGYILGAVLVHLTMGAG